MKKEPINRMVKTIETKSQLNVKSVEVNRWEVFTTADSVISACTKWTIIAHGQATVWGISL